MRNATCIILTALSLALLGGNAVAEEKKNPAGGPPPMLVTTTEIVKGTAEPSATFVGTVYFSRTAEVAAEVEGIVRQVYSDDGQSVKRGDRLVRLDDDLMVTEIAGTRAVYEQNLVELEQAERDYKRIEALHQQNSIATSEFESYGTKVNRLQKQSIVLMARLDRLLLEQKKKTVRAPFDGIIIETLVEAGEWVKAGGTIATLADNHNLEARVDIPVSVISHLTPGQEVTIVVAEQEMTGHFITIIPRGDIITRTFVAKFKLAGNAMLIEGMQVQISLPTAAASESLLVPRDAVLNIAGQDVIFIHNSGQAHMITVEITGHTGTQVGIKSSEINTSQKVIVKGNERIRDGQSVRTE
jgi:RND family efflux transporter MFP subunit